MTDLQFAMFLNNIDNGTIRYRVKHTPNGLKVLCDILFELTQTQNEIACDHLEAAGLLKLVFEYNQSH